MSQLAPIAEAEEPSPPSLQASARKPVPCLAALPSLPSTPDLSPSPPPDSRPEPRPRSRSAERAAFAEARALYESGVAVARTNPLAATRHFRQAAAVFGEMDGQEKRRDKALWQAGMCYAGVAMRAKKRAEGETARAALEQARSCFHFINERGKEAMAVYQLGLVTGELSVAAEYIKLAAGMYAEMGDEAREAMCYAELGHLFSATDPDAAIFSLRHCLLLYLKLGDSHREGKVLYTIGLLAMSKLADRKTGHNYLAQARVVFRRCGSVAEEADACYQLGKVCVRQGAFEPAVRYFEEASSLFHNVKLVVDEAWAIYRLALVMLKVRSAPLAIDYLAEARKLFADAPSDERHAEGSCCLRIAEILGGTVAAAGEGAAEGWASVRDEERAREFFDEAARLLAETQSPTPANSPSLSRSRSRGRLQASAPSPSPSPLARRRSTMSVGRVEERKRQLRESAMTSEAAMAAAGTEGSAGHGQGEEVRESGRAGEAKGGVGGEGAWWAVADR